MVATSVGALSFLVYAFCGWLIEFTEMIRRSHRIGNPGFLTGPVVPIYGVGAWSVLLVTRDVTDSPLSVFVLAVAIATVVEFCGHLVLEKTVHLVLWDYSGRLGNIQGRVCLVNSLAFGAGGLAAVYLINPPLTRLLHTGDPVVLVAAASALMTLLAVDWADAVVSVIRVRPEIRAVQGGIAEIRAGLEAQLDGLDERLRHDLSRQRAGALRAAGRVLRRVQLTFPAARSSSTHGDPTRGVLSDSRAGARGPYLMARTRIIRALKRN